MKKRIIGLVLGASLVAASLAGCNINYSVNTGNGDEAVEEVAEAEDSTDKAAEDQEAADQVAALIDAIYVQQRTETTDEDCKAAKQGWDSLTDEQKALVEGEEADPDYFGRDTGDASKDDPLNQDDIGENEILVVSFGTSFNDSRAEDIGGIEKAIIKAFPDWSVRRGFTAQIIINHVQARDEEFIDNVDQALERAVNNNVKNLVVQPTHLMHGAEYDEMVDSLMAYVDKFDSIIVSEPLLGQVGAEDNTVNDDKKIVSEAVTAQALDGAGYADIEAAKEDGTAFVFMGHGTAHAAKITYSQVQTQMGELGYDNVFIGTVEGEPESTACESVIEAVKDAGYKKVILRPLMVVAGDHANNDMAGDEEDSWKSLFKASGYFDSVDAQIAGLGRIEKVEDLYVQHLKDAIENGTPLEAEALTEEVSDLEDGVYAADFDTDSTMFHVNDTADGKGILTVAEGKMTIHIVMPSQSIVNLFLGTAEDAQKDGAQLIDATEEEVAYDDGTVEKVNAFDVEVPVLGEEFDLAILGTKGKWYDHKVTVSNPVAVEETEAAQESAKEAEEAVADGEYQLDVVLEGGTGKATVESPAKAVVKDGQIIVTLCWSSKHYDYMIVDGEKYLPVNKSGNSVFEIPIAEFNCEKNVIADTTAMSEPHEIEYTLYFNEAK